MDRLDLPLRSVQLLRAIAVVLVIVLHVYAFEPHAGLGETLLPAVSVFGSSGVDLFFVISGFIMVFTTNRLIPGVRAAAEFMRRRVLRVYPMYWIYSSVLLLAFLISPSIFRRQDISSLSFVKSFMLYPQAQEPLLIVGWTLIHEVYFYLVFALILLLRRKYHRIALFVWALSVCSAAIVLPEEQRGPGTALLVNPLTLEFIFGCGVGMLVLNGRGNSTWLIAGGVFWLFGGWVFHFYYFDGAGLTLGQRVLVLGAPYALLLWGAVRLEIEGRWKARPVIESLGDASYSIYLSHFLVISALTRLSAFLSSKFGVTTSTSVDSVIFFAGCLGISLLFGWLSYSLVERPLQGLIRYHGKGRRLGQPTTLAGQARE
jgi:exopolysaccharide production protein ExoZ